MASVYVGFVMTLDVLGPEWHEFAPRSFLCVWVGCVGPPHEFNSSTEGQEKAGHPPLTTLREWDAPWGVFALWARGHATAKTIQLWTSYPAGLLIIFFGWLGGPYLVAEAFLLVKLLRGCFWPKCQVDT